MNEIEIKQEPIDYDDVLVSNEVQQQMQHEEIKDINTVSIKEELVDSLTDEQFNNFQILNEEADIITLAPTADKSEDELNFIQLFDIFGGNNKKRKLAENATTCIHPKQIRQREYDFDGFAANHVDVLIKCEPNLSYEENMPCLPTIPDIKQEIDDDLSAACQTNSNRDDNKILHDVRIKDEPVDYDEAIQINSKAARIGGNNGETPIPKIKIPANLFNSLKNASSTNLYTANIESYKNNFKPNFVATTTNTLDIKKLIPSSSTVTTTITKIHNNILQPIKYSNNAFVLKAPLNTPQTTTTNSNIKILKLPPNTKIIKLDSKQSLNNKNKIITASTPITSIQIKQGENSTPTFLVTSTSPTILKSSQSQAQTQPTTKLIGEIGGAVQSTPSEQQLKDRIIAEQKKQKSIHFVSKPALDFIENLPESRKAINELLQQVKKAETSNPLTPNFTTVIKKKQSASVTWKTQIEAQDIKPVNKALSKCIKVELSEPKIKHEPTDDIEVKFNVDESTQDSNSSMHPTMLDNVVRVVQMRLKGDDAVLLKARRENINNRCFWLCPRCPRQYAQRTTMRQHLENHHALSDAELDALTLEVRIIRIGNDNVKVDLSAITEMSNITNDERIEESIPEMTGNGDEAGNNKSRKRESNKYKCDKCGRSCSSKVTLIDHIVANCSREPQYQCSQCPKKFYSVSTLNCHVTIHTGELPHKCNYCDKRFRTRGQVTVHHRTHTGERPFKCQVCSQCFTHRETLIAHLSRHIGMKRYKCYGCNKLFSCISGLRTHRETRPDSCGRVKFNPRALGPRVRVVKGNVIFEPQPEINPYLRSEEPPAVTDS